MRAKRYPVITEQTATGYSAYSPDIAGCVAVGDTKNETRRNIQKAPSAHFQAMREIGEPIPEPTRLLVTWKSLGSCQPARSIARVSCSHSDYS
jgi:predicted RNase H-like HicB family nuclease